MLESKNHAPKAIRWVHFDVPVAVQNPPSTSAVFRSESMDYEMVLICAQTLYVSIPAMILEVTTDVKKLATFSNFSHMFLRAKNCAQNIVEHDGELVSILSGGWKGSVHESIKNRSIWPKNIQKKHWNSENILYIVREGVSQIYWKKMTVDARIRETAHDSVTGETG